jgi:hypothetical protein
MVDLRGQVVLAARIEIAAHHWHRPNVTEAQQMSQLGQSRRFGPPPMTSGLPPEADTVTDGRHVSKVPIVLQKSKIERRRKSRKS